MSVEERVNKNVKQLMADYYVLKKYSNSQVRHHKNADISNLKNQAMPQVL
jgi:hypothetical protein